MTRAAGVLAAGLLLTSCQKGTHFHVSPSGDDSEDGSKSRPFATLNRVKAAARASTEKPVTVWLAGGDYHFEKPFELGKEDSGTAEHPIVYRAMVGQSPRLLGGKQLTSSWFQPVTAAAALARIAGPARGKVLALVLKAQGVTHSKPYPDVFTDAGSIVDLFCNGQHMTPSRYPNDGWMTFKSVFHTAGGPQGEGWKDPATFQKVPPGSSGGIWFGGGDEAARPRIPAGHQAVNNQIHHFGQIEPVYAAGINCGFTGGGGGGYHPSVGMYVAHNVVHDTPPVGVLCGSMDSVFEYNEVYRYRLVSNDMGGFYSYDYGKRNFGNLTFRHNFIHSSPLGDGIYFDHDHPEMKVIGNVVALGSTGTRGTGYLFKQGDMPKDGKTQPFDCVGNIAADCKSGFGFVSLRRTRGGSKTTWPWTATHRSSGAKSKTGKSCPPRISPREKTWSIRDIPVSRIPARWISAWHRMRSC